MSDPSSYFSRMLRGELAPPPVFGLLGGSIRQVDTQGGTLEVEYTATPAFLNPAGTVQGGMLCAMLDDLCAAVVDATLHAGEGVATLSLNTSFIRPAQPGALLGRSRIVRRGRDVCFVQGVLLQQDQEVANASAVCKLIPPRT